MNKQLKSILISANGLDYYGCPVADGSLSVTNLEYLSEGRAEEVYRDLNTLITTLKLEVEEAKKQQKIKQLKKELEELEK